MREFILKKDGAVVTRKDKKTIGEVIRRGYQSFIPVNENGVQIGLGAEKYKKKSWAAERVYSEYTMKEKREIDRDLVICGRNDKMKLLIKRILDGGFSKSITEGSKKVLNDGLNKQNVSMDIIIEIRTHEDKNYPYMLVLPSVILQPCLFENFLGIKATWGPNTQADLSVSKYLSYDIREAVNLASFVSECAKSAGICLNKEKSEPW